MSKMNDLTVILEEMTETGRALITCGENLIGAVRSMQHWPGEPESPKAETGRPEAGSATDPGTGNTSDASKPARRTRASKHEVPAAETETPAPTTESTKPETMTPEYTKEQIRAMLAALADSGHREEAKALVQKYADGGSFSGIDPARYPELAEEVKQYA